MDFFYTFFVFTNFCTFAISFWSCRVTHNCSVTLSWKFKWMSGTSFFWYNVNLLRAVSLSLREGWLPSFPLAFSGGEHKRKDMFMMDGQLFKVKHHRVLDGRDPNQDVCDVTRQTGTSFSWCRDVRQGESQQSRRYHCFLKRRENSPGSTKVDGQVTDFCLSLSQNNSYWFSFFIFYFFIWTVILYRNLLYYCETITKATSLDLLALWKSYLLLLLLIIILIKIWL